MGGRGGRGTYCAFLWNQRRWLCCSVAHRRLYCQRNQPKYHNQWSVVWLPTVNNRMDYHSYQLHLNSSCGIDEKQKKRKFKISFRFYVVARKKSFRKVPSNGRIIRLKASAVYRSIVPSLLMAETELQLFVGYTCKHTPNTFGSTKRTALTHCNYDVVDHCLMESVYRKLNYLVVPRHFVHAFVLDETALRLRLFPFASLTFVQILQLHKRENKKKKDTNSN